MNIPSVVDNKWLAKNASPNDTRAVRVVVRRVANQSPYRVRGRHRHYLAEFDPKLAAHVLTVPESLWMADFPAGPYRDNLSIAHDLNGTRAANMAPLVFLLAPWGTGNVMAEAAAPADTEPLSADGVAILASLETLFVKQGAPDVVHEALHLLRSRGSDAELVERLRAAVDGYGHDEPENISATPEPAPEPKPEPQISDAARRQREYRARKKAQRQAAKAKA